jgi:hypothetical protein
MRRLLVALIAIVLWRPLGVVAQDLANIVGTLSDASGAVVADAKITVSNPEKGFVRTEQSDSGGEYSFARVPLGNYTITAQKAGFGKLVRTGITLDAGQTFRVPLSLKVGSVSEEVIVASDPVRVETETLRFPHLSAFLLTNSLSTRWNLIPSVTPRHGQIVFA